MERDSSLFVCLFLLFSLLSLEKAEANEPVLSSERWGIDIRIGDKDSVNAVAFDVDYSTGNLFAALKNTESGIDFCTVYMSSDTGKTWMETGFIGPGTGAIDAAVFEGYFYVTYSIGDAIYARRFSTSNGAYDAVSGIDTLPAYSGGDVKEIALASGEGFPFNKFLHCFAIFSNNRLRYYYGSTPGSWAYGAPALNADRGLDACCNDGYEGSPSKLAWCSYIGTNDSVYIVSSGVGFSSYGPLTDVYYSISGLPITSIGAYRDTVMVLYPYCGGEFAYFVNSCASYDGGNNWEYEGTLFGPSATTWGASAVTARRGDGFGAVIICSNYGLYRYRDYPAGEWIDSVRFTDDLVKPQVKPAIERIATNSYGIIYVDYPAQGAFFDISQWPSGIEENSPGEKEACLLEATPSVFSSRISIEYILPTRQIISLDIYDLLGNHIINLVSGQVPAGKNSTAWEGKNASGKPVTNGVYICVLKADGNPSISTKVTLLK
jgi:hypothetical protein